MEKFKKKGYTDLGTLRFYLQLALNINQLKAFVLPFAIYYIRGIP